MKFKIGDNVRYLNDIGGGKIMKLINDKEVIIEDEFGFNIPIYANELVLVDSNENNFLNIKGKNNIEQETNYHKKNDIVIEQEPINDVFEEELPEIYGNEHKIMLGVVNNTNIFSFYIINDSEYNLFCNILQVDNNSFKSVYNSKLESDTKEQFVELTNLSIQDGLNFVFQIIFIAKTQINLQSPIEKAVYLPSVKLIKDGSYKENDYFDENAIIIPIFEYGLKTEVDKLSQEELAKIIKQKQESTIYSEQLATKYATQKNTEIVEVDLHIQEVLDNFSGLSNTEMLLAQLQKFHSEMKNAISNRVNKIVFIHGVGNGTLKNELRKSLQQDYSKFKFQDASFKEYGFGATIVYIS